MLEDDTPEVAAEEAIEGETLKIQGPPIDTTTTDPERAQKGDSGEGDQRSKWRAMRRHSRQRSGGCRSLRRRVEAPESSDGGDLYGVGVAWPRRTKLFGRRSKLQLR